MTHPAQRRLDTIDTDIRWLRTGALHRALTNLTLTTPDGWPPGGTRDGGRGTDPWAGVPNAAFAGLANRTRYLEIDALTAELHGIVNQLVAAVRAIGDPDTDTDREWRQQRCLGGTGDWAKPECTGNVVRRVLHEGQRLPLCWACIKRGQRAGHRLEADPSERLGA